MTVITATSSTPDAAEPGGPPPGGGPPQRVLLLDEARLSRSVLALAWPVLVQQMALSLVQLVDTFLVGHLGTDALAGVGLATFIQWTPQAGVFALTAGTTAVLARDIGAGDQRGASASMRHGVLFSLVWGVLTALLVFSFAAWSMGAMGATGDTLHQGARWLRWATPGLAASSVLFVANGCLQGAGDTRTPMMVMIVVNIINAFVAYVYIYGSWFFPRLGVAGSGIGFSASQVLGALLIVALLARGRGGLRLQLRSLFVTSRAVSGRILRVGVPAGIENLQFQFAMLAYTRVIASLGDVALAAHNVALRVQGLAFMPGQAFSQAATAMTGQALGADRPKLAERAVFIAARYAVIILCSVAVLLCLLGGPITRVFINDAAVTDHGRKLLLVFAGALPAIAIAFTLAGSLRGAGDTRTVMYIFAISPWVMRVPIAYFFAIVLGWGVEGAWIGAVLDMWTRVILVGVRFHTGKWKTIRV